MMKLDDLPFCYPPAKWQKIAAEVPPNIDAEKLRKYMETIASAHVVCWWESSQRSRPTLGADISSHQRLATCAREFINAYTEQLALVDEVHIIRSEAKRRRRRSDLISQVDALAHRHQKYADYLKSRKARRGPKGDFFCDFFLEQLVELWIRIGGKLGTSVTNGKPGGPLVRFLVNASASLLQKDLTENAAREFVRKRKCADPQHGENSFRKK